MRTGEHFDELEHELECIKWHIIGSSETRLPGEKTTTLYLRHLLYQKNSAVNNHLGGVGFFCEQ